jgi:hypothetical protein
MTVADSACVAGYRFADLGLDLGRPCVTGGDEGLALGRLSYEFLWVVVAAAPEVVTQAQLIDNVWRPSVEEAKTGWRRTDSFGVISRVFHTRRSSLEENACRCLQAVCLSNRSCELLHHQGYGVLDSGFAPCCATSQEAISKPMCFGISRRFRPTRVGG